MKLGELVPYLRIEALENEWQEIRVGINLELYIAGKEKLAGARLNSAG